MAEKENGGGTCLFSGQPTKTKKARFLPGYDAKFKALLLSVMRGHEPITKVRKAALPLLESPEGLCGFRLKGGKLVHTGKFKIAAEKAPKAKAAKPVAKAAPAVKARPKVVRRKPAPAADAVEASAE